MPSRTSCTSTPTGRAIDPAGYDLIVPLGSEEHAYDDGVPWIERELTILRRAASLGIPTFGICFGGQSLARALGGSVQRAPAPEIGWFEVRTSDPDLIAPGPWFQWHFDSFIAPPGATVLAESAVGPQAFAVGRAIGLQFHPEVTAEIVGMWAAESTGAAAGGGSGPRRPDRGDPRRRASVPRRRLEAVRRAALEADRGRERPAVVRFAEHDLHLADPTLGEARPRNTRDTCVHSRRKRGVVADPLELVRVGVELLAPARQRLARNAG